MKHICEQCKKNFSAPPSQGARFCSRNCYDEGRKGYFICDNCEIVFTHYKSHKKGDKVFCSRKCHMEHMTKDVRNHPRWKGKNYRLILSEHVGRKLDPSDIVHHRNGDHSDNRIENLELTTRSGHMRTHFHSGGRWARNWDKCTDCGTTEVKHEVHGLCYECYKKSLRK